jgi:predicted transport protein
MHTDPTGQYDLVQLFTQDSAELVEFLSGALRAQKEEAVFWVCYPKRSSGLKTDLTRDQGWEALHKAGFRTVALVSINDTWTAARFRSGQDKGDQELLESQYAGAKQALRPIYERLVKAALSLGPDVEVAPRKTYVVLMRKNVFALIKPSTPSRIDLGLKLKDKKGDQRLEEAAGFGSGSITHKIILTSPNQVDGQVIGWLREAYAQVG